MNPSATDLSDVFLHFGIALGLGLLVGLQRERADSRLAGVRTFALVTVSGTLAAYLGQALGGWVVAAGVVSLAGLLVTGNLIKLKSGRVDPGLTTEVAMLLMFGVGAFLVVGPAAVAIAVGGAVAVLLYLKPQLHGLAEKLGDGDFRAIMQFALLTLVILPVLPDRELGPYQVLNPREIWLMVVLIVGLGLSGYLAYKLLGDRGGTILAGLLGGVISSTATTVSYSRRAAASPAASGLAAMVVIVASGVSCLRLLIEIGVVARGFLPSTGPPLGLMLGAFALYALLLWRRRPADGTEAPEAENPSELKPALIFAALYAVILVAVEAARRHFGETGLYAVAALSGLTDLDAITLSTSNLVSSGRLEQEVGTRLVVLAVLANLVFKAGVVAFLGNRALLLRVAVGYALAAAAGLAWLLF